MRKKILWNVLYNIGIFLCIVLGYQEGIATGNYIFAGGAVLIIAILVMQKIKLLREVKNAQKP